MISVCDLAPPVEGGVSGGRVFLGSLEACRPERCPGCSHPACAADGRLNLRGHGSYVRQVLGLGKKILSVRIRRFVCKVCRVTISVLAAWIHPWRWYASKAIAEALWRWEVLAQKAAFIRRRLMGGPEQPAEDAASKPQAAGKGAKLRGQGDTKGWVTLRRWAMDFLASKSLYGWLGGARARAVSLAGRLSRFVFGRRPEGEPELRNWTLEAVRACAVEALLGTRHGCAWRGR